MYINEISGMGRWAKGALHYCLPTDGTPQSADTAHSETEIESYFNSDSG